MIKAAIFDIDGTLLDSMPIWQDVGRRYLRSLGIKAKADLEEKLDVLSLPEGVDYIKKEYGLHFPKEEMIDNIKQIVKDFYDKEAQLKPGAKTLVESLAKNNIPMIIATASDRDMAQAALERNEIWHFFTGWLPVRKQGQERPARKYLKWHVKFLEPGKKKPGSLKIPSMQCRRQRRQVFLFAGCLTNTAGRIPGRSKSVPIFMSIV